MSSLLLFLQESAAVRLLDSSRFVSMSVQILHVLGFTLLLAFAVLFSLRVWGLVLAAQPLAAFTRSVLRSYHWSVAVALVAGLLLFLPRATAYAANPALRWKLALLVPAVVLQYLLLVRARRTAGASPSPWFKAGALLVLALWFIVGAAGRAIGFIA